MARLALNKSSLSKLTRQLGTFERFLPSLDLKRKQLMAERAKAQPPCSAPGRRWRAAREHRRAVCRCWRTGKSSWRIWSC